MSTMNKSEFLVLVEPQLRDVFKEAQLGTRSSKAKHRCEGFMQCGRVMGIVGDSDLNNLMEKVHKEIFNMSIAERKAEKLKLHQQMQDNEYKDLNIPAFLRERQRPLE